MPRYRFAIPPHLHAARADGNVGHLLARPGSSVRELRRSRAGQNWYWTAARCVAIGWMNLAMMSRCSGWSR